MPKEGISQWHKSQPTNAVDPSNDPTRDLEDLAHDAISALKRFLSNRDTTPQAVVQARVAATVLSSWSRQRQTAGAQVATTFMMAREIASNTEELKAYIALTLPDHPLVRALPVAQAKAD